ncbi:MAG TPA: hypothetical protein VEQ58_17325 [Polyangiaceae bacterium]|nr:hypothetical protein [Polyangiaceae bacterium]
MTCRKWPRGSLLLALLAGASTLGCGKLREVSLCRGIASDVNQALDDIELMSKAKPLDELRIARRYAALATTLTPRSVGEKPLAVAVRDYITVLHATEAAVRNHDNVQKTQPTRIGEPRRELERLVKRDHAAAARIDVECHN